ncbi:hypothetical protein ACLB9X_00005, partial [Streptomyces sp. 5K101]|uniref:hypothetical protein n=1 Tax=Streptomyces sp. 5K101 TaxID=3390037 RepID=UPI003974BDFA
KARVHIRRAEQPVGIGPVVHSVLAVIATPRAGWTFQRNLDHPEMDGVSTYLALIFGTLLSSQGTDASFVLTLVGLSSGRFPSVLRFRLYQTLSCPIPGRRDCFQFFAFAFPFRRRHYFS